MKADTPSDAAELDNYLAVHSLQDQLIDLADEYGGKLTPAALRSAWEQRHGRDLFTVDVRAHIPSLLAWNAIGYRVSKQVFENDRN